jgi:hypothetical protein
LEQLELALRLTQGDSRDEAAVTQEIGRLHEARGEFGAAREWLETSLSLFRELGDEVQEKTTREAIARVAPKTHD